MNDINFNTLSDLIKEHARINSCLPSMDIPRTSTMGVAVERTKPIITTKEESVEEAVDGLVSHFKKTLADEGFADGEMDTLDQISDAFYEKVKNAFSDLHVVRDLVDQVHKRIEDEVDDQVGADPTLAASSVTALDEDPHIPEIDWTGVRKVGAERKVVSMVNSQFTDFNGKDSTFAQALKRACAKTSAKLSQKWTGGEVTNETKKRIVSEISEAKNIPTDRLNQVVSALLSADIGVRRYTRKLDRLRKMSDNMKVCSETLTEIDEINAVMDQIKKVELSNATREIIDYNTDLLSEIRELYAYYIIHCRRYIFGETVLLPNGQINPDTIQDFRDNGGSIRLLQHYVKYFAPEGKAENLGRGVTIKAALDAKPAIDKRANTDSVKTETYVKNEMNRIYKDSFIRNMNILVNQTSDDSSALSLQVPVKDANEVISLHSDRLVHRSTLDDALYGTIMNLYYRNSFVRTLYTRLGVECTKDLASVRNVTEENIRLIEVKVVTDLVTEFIVDNGLAVAS